MTPKYVLIIFFLFVNYSFSQLDTLKSQWPVTPLNSSHGINGGFSEFRNTLDSDHFHNAVDIGEPDGEPCYSVFDGEVFTIGNSGSNSYVRVATQINGKWKHLTYLHIEPNPSLEVGDPVQKGVTILGTIYPGMGHVHLGERELVSDKSSSGAYINNIRNNGGLTPYNDPYPPIIYRNSLKFFMDGTNTQLPAHGLTGKVDIQIKIEDHNGTTSSQTNNGTYLAGFRIWSADTTTIVFEPNDAGVKYRFDKKPYNSSVHQVFVEDLATLSNPVYWLTNGTGASGINQTLEVNNNYFNTTLLDTGDYVLQIFTEDTRSNKDSEYFPIFITDQDLSAPKTPELNFVLNTDLKKSVHISWTKNSEKDLAGYRLYYSLNSQLSAWELAANETQLTKDSTEFFIESSSEFVVPPAQDVYYFRLTAVDTNGNESGSGDKYARSSFTDGTNFPTALIVNGFTRYGGSGSWQNPVHSFVKSYFEPLLNSDSVVISSCSNQAVIDGKINMGNYNFVIWFVGDESTADDTFTPTEQSKIKAFLEAGGKLFVSGSEIGWDLEEKGSDDDISFYHNYFKARYFDDGNTSMSPAKGTASTMFNNVQLNFGQVYVEDYPDDIGIINGSEAILYYNQIRSGTNYRKAGVAYTGTFGQSQEIGQIVYISFPLETVSSLDQRSSFMTTLLQYFDIISDIENRQEIIPGKLSLSQNFPNPFNPQTTFKVFVPKTQKIKITIFDLLGRRVKNITNKQFTTGEYEFTWDAGSQASGFYIVELKTGKTRYTRKILLLK
ncbi:MAG: T9SS C-terminal target domain-containing protein [Calditrichaeota bacterium]|nr:MAG: T9SS C-terminal target domain-containing protein [Calditrichota bacterium]MBL1207887.1 T9SS C-terminal target domain-containing protein [Calditrichota bacterium]NOG47722.1 T9SS type A sorting domain-containing protein [Calditrichota bacterium]